MKKNIPVIIALLALTTACSNSKKESQVAEAEAVGMEADFIVDSSEEFLFDDSVLFDEGQAPMAQTTEESDYIETMSADTSMAPMVEETAYVSEGMSEYIIKDGETLMMVAFNIYGDYGKWKDLKAWNPGVQSSNAVAGTRLQYREPAEKFVFNPMGLPHLIRKGDSLGSISQEKYGTLRRWKDIYDNNQPLIKDPNLIFAGFTLYYVPDREIASER